MASPSLGDPKKPVKPPSNIGHMRGRPSKLDNPEFAKSVGEAYANGMSFTDMGEIFGVAPNTVSTWCKNPVVAAHSARAAQERILRIVRKTDVAIENRLESVDDEDKVPTELLLKIRKEFIDRSIRVESDAAASSSAAENSIIGKLEENPDLARQLQEWTAGKKKK